MIVTSIFKYKFNPILLSGYLVSCLCKNTQKYAICINIFIKVWYNINEVIEDET